MRLKVVGATLAHGHTLNHSEVSSREANLSTVHLQASKQSKLVLTFVIHSMPISHSRTGNITNNKTMWSKSTLLIRKKLTFLYHNI